MNRAVRYQRICFFVASGACFALLLSGSQLPPFLLVASLAFLVVLLGLPHGSLDPLVAWKAGLWKGAIGLAAFLGAYLVFSGVAVLLWISLPLVALVLFLAYSAWHFAGDWRESLAFLPRLAAGLVIVSGPALFHAEEVTSYFSILSGNEEGSAGLVRVLSVLSIPSAATMIGSTIWSVRRNPVLSAELSVLALAALLLPPLLFFVLYFCGLHSPRHLIEAVEGMRKSTAIPVGGIVTLVTVLAAASVIYFLPDGPLDERIIQIVFIGLAVLTVPHMILIEHAAGRRIQKRYTTFEE